MKTLTAWRPMTLLRLSRLLRVGALIAATWAFRGVFAHRASLESGVGFAVWTVLEISAYRLRKWRGNRSSQVGGT